VFNLCESMAGDPRNEPTFDGLLDLFAIPYTGADLLCLASCLHKRRAKDVLLARGLPTPPYRFLADPGAVGDPALDALDYPWFVKLAHEDASVGITEENLVATPAALRKRAGELMAEHDQAVLAERYVDGRELNVTLIGRGPPGAAAPRSTSPRCPPTVRGSSATRPSGTRATSTTPGPSRCRCVTPARP
jgi:D-alanine-D-alanine ligase